MCGDATCSAASSTSTSSPLRRDDRVSAPHGIVRTAQRRREPGFPRPTGEPELPHELVLEPRGRVVVARTPVGRFALVPGEVVYEESLTGLDA
jgi:hypothetical protein